MQSPAISQHISSRRITVATIAHVRLNFTVVSILHSASRSIPIALSCAANLSALAFSPSARRSACSALSRSCSALSRSCSIRSLPQNSKGSSVCAMQWTGLLGMKLL